MTPFRCRDARMAGGVVGFAMLATFPGVASAASPPASPAVDVPDTPAMLEALASDAAAGRGAGTPQLRAAGLAVRDWFAAAAAPAGVEPVVQYFPGPGADSLFNVIAVLPGSGEEWIAVGAHYDGLGLGQFGTDHAGQILNGADDNASGVAALVLILEALAAEPRRERSVALIAFSGEETGLHGSRAFTEEPPLPLERCVAMLNLDTVGRIEDGRLVVFGTGTADEFPDMLRGINYAFGFDLAFNAPGGGASDHAPFHEKGIPALHFFSGAKPEYHGPADDVHLVDVEQLERLAGFVAEAAFFLSDAAEPVTFRPAGADKLVARPVTKTRRVSFGSIPDFSREAGGILLSGVMPGSPAEAAGLRKGDILTGLGEWTLDTLDDFQAALAAHEPGDTVEAVFTRDGEERRATVTLKERRR